MSSLSSRSEVRTGPVPTFLQKISANWSFNFVYTKIWSVVFERRDAAFRSDNYNYNLLENIKMLLTKDGYYDDKNKFFPNGYNWGIDYPGQYTDSDKQCSPYYHLLDMGEKDDTNILVDNGKGHFLLANKLTIPQESMNITGVNGIQDNNLGGVMFGRIAANRYASPQIRKVKIDFLDTNFNFAERFVKPWIVACAQRGLIESSDLPELKCNIHTYFFAKSSPNYRITHYRDTVLSNNSRSIIDTFGPNEDMPFCHSEIIFHDCVPLTVGEKHYNYSPTMDVSETISNVEFSYDYYTVKSNIDKYPQNVEDVSIKTPGGEMLIQ